VPVNFSQIARLFEQVIDLDTFVVTASPMAAGGSFSRGTHNDFTSVAARRARRLIVEMNRNIPRVFGQSQIHDRDDLRLLHRHRHPPPRMTFTTELTGAPKERQPARLLQCRRRRPDCRYRCFASTPSIVAEQRERTRADARTGLALRMARDSQLSPQAGLPSRMEPTPVATGTALSSAKAA
jgi:Acetyl-CoA hydrolase/transferase N-terminal domain